MTLTCPSADLQGRITFESIHQARLHQQQRASYPVTMAVTGKSRSRARKRVTFLDELPFDEDEREWELVSSRTSDSGSEAWEILSDDS